MIITDISAENILKYQRLELHDLPTSGIIAVCGQNESGKSTIGETICFALFGRTFSLATDELTKLIRWGEAECTVKLHFTAGDEKHYELARFLDLDGNQGVRLNLVGQEEAPLARGVSAVERSLSILLGFGYDEFVDSFYLAQREITTPHPHSDAVKVMAGITPLERLGETFAQESVEGGGVIEQTERQIAGVEEDEEALGIEPGLLESLQGERDGLVKAGMRLDSCAQGLEEGLSGYESAHSAIHATRRSRGSIRLLRTLLVFATVLLAAFAGALTFSPENPIGQALTSLVSAQLPAWNQDHLRWTWFLAAGTGLLGLFAWWRIARLGSQWDALMEHPRRLAGAVDGLRRLLGERAEQAPDVDPTSVEANATASDQKPERITPLVGERIFQSLASQEELTQLSAGIAQAKTDPGSARDSLEREMTWLKRNAEENRSQLGEIEQRIVRESDRRKRADQLNQMKSSLCEKVATERRNIYLRELAQELLEGAAERISQRFNRDLRELVGRTLPLFTEERYQHLEIGEDLSVRVFSNDKRGYMDLEEISSGTQRQIMLAVRLALSQELTNSSIRGRQFIFLDEPFAFFDQERTRNAIRALPRLSDDITQIWVVAQEFPERETFDATIACSRTQRELWVA